MERVVEMEQEQGGNEMGRKKKHPEHNPEQLMNELLDNLVQVWTGEKEPELKAVSAELEMSPAKVRKLLITAGERDHTTYFQSSTADQVKRMKTEGLSVAEIQEITGLGYTSVQGYLPHKHIYNLETISAENERIRLFRKRKAAVEELRVHLDLPDWSLFLWRCVIAFEGYQFSTSGSGKKLGVKFKYHISREAGRAGRKYSGESVEGFGNEMWITTDGAEKKKSISRSTVDLAYKNARRGLITGPKKLGVPGADSYLYPVFVRFGVIG